MAAAFTSTSPGLGVGVGSSTGSNTSVPPVRLIWIAFIVTPLLDYFGEQRLGALIDRFVDHLAVELDGAKSLGKSLVVTCHDPARGLDLFFARREALVEDRHHGRMHAARAVE